jgi:vitamin B12 transporter
MHSRSNARRTAASPRASSSASLAAARALVAALPALAAASAAAQSAAGAGDTPDQQVVVTAARTPQKLPDALPSTVVLTREDIEAAPATDLPGLLRTLTSVSLAQTGPLGSQTSVFMRGADSRQVLVLIDGAPLARADFGSAPWELVPLDQIERVEIVRGNLSSLYGAQAVGGVVQIFTRRGAGTSVSGYGGNDGQFALSGSAGRRFGDPVTPLELSASVSAQTTDGFSARDPAVDPGANPDRDPGHQAAASGAIAKTWAPGQRTSFSAMHTDTTSHYDGYNGNDLNDVLHTTLDAFSLRSDHELGAALALDLSAGETLDHYSDPTGFNTAGSARTRLLGAQLDWRAMPDQDLQLQYENRNERYEDTNDPRHVRTTNSVRAGWLGTFAKTIDVQANVRHDDSSDYGGATTGLAALGWRITPAWKLVGQWSNAFSAPSFVDQQYDNGVQLKPERSREWEVGVHWQAPGWLARATWFSQRQNDLIAYDENFNTVNIGHASNKGLELIADGALGPGKLGLDATFQDPRDEDTDTALVRRARTVAALNYRVPVASWEAAAWTRYTGPHADIDPVTFAPVEAPSRWVFGLSAQHALSPEWTIAVKVDNLFDSRTQEVLGYTAPPRSILLQLRGHWQ